MRRVTIRAILSTLLIICVLFLAFSGALLFFGKTGMVWGIARNDLRAAHFWVAVLTCVLAAVHLFANRRVYMAELRMLRGNPADRDREL